MNSAPVKTSNNSVKPEILKTIHTYIFLLEDTVEVSHICSKQNFKITNCHIFASSVFAYVLSFRFWHNGYCLCYIFSHLLSCSSVILKFQSQQSIDSSFFTSL